MNKDLEIPFVGLKQGIHNFKFEIERSFFDAFPYSIIEEGKITVGCTFILGTLLNAEKANLMSFCSVRWIKIYKPLVMDTLAKYWYDKVVQRQNFLPTSEFKLRLVINVISFPYSHD